MIINPIMETIHGDTPAFISILAVVLVYFSNVFLNLFSIHYHLCGYLLYHKTMIYISPLNLLFN